MRNSCPFCEEESVVKQITKRERIPVRGEPTEATTTYNKCSSCGNEYVNTMDEHDSLAMAYRRYRKKHNMLQPEEIRRLRKSIGLTQGELSDLLGLGKASISRYENGSLQDRSHDIQLRLLQDPRFVLRRIQESPSALPLSKLHVITKRLKNRIRREHIMDYLVEESLPSDRTDESSGRVPFAVKKLNDLILYFCRERRWKSEINKLLFYADFKHYKEHGKGITGCRYKPLSLGPAPELYETILGRLADEGALEMTEVFVEPNISGLECRAARDPDLSTFSDSELDAITTVKAYFKDYGAKELRDFLSDEKACRETKPGQRIKYSYAKELKI